MSSNTNDVSVLNAVMESLSKSAAFNLDETAAVFGTAEPVADIADFVSLTGYPSHDALSDVEAAHNSVSNILA